MKDHRLDLISPQGAHWSYPLSLLSGLKTGLPASLRPKNPGFPQSSPLPDLQSPSLKLPPSCCFALVL